MNVVYYIACLCLPIVFSHLLIHHDNRVLLFSYVGSAIVLFLVYAKSYAVKGREKEPSLFPETREERFLYFTGGLFQLFALLSPFFLLRSLAPVDVRRGSSTFPDLTFDLVGPPLFWSLVFFLLGRSCIAVLRLQTPAVQATDSPK